MGGYRLSYDDGPARALVIELGGDLLDTVQRLKVIETVVLEAEAQRAEFDEARREAEANAPSRGGRR